MHAASFDLAEFKQPQMKSWHNYKVRNLKCTEQREAGSHVARILYAPARGTSQAGWQPLKVADSIRPDSTRALAAQLVDDDGYKGSV